MTVTQFWELSFHERLGAKGLRVIQIVDVGLLKDPAVSLASNEKMVERCSKNRQCGVEIVGGEKGFLLSPMTIALLY
jgi:hypothetical protein